MSPDQIQGWLQLGLGGLMLAALFLGFKRIWVWGWVYEAKAKECEFWQKTALDLLTVNDKAITVAERDG